MQKVYKTMVFEIILQKGIEKISPFLNCPILQNTISLQKLFVRKYKIPSELFQIKFSYLILIEIFGII